MNTHTILLYDGECSFCNGAVQWIIARDPHANIRFASQQGELGQQLLDKHKLPVEIDSLILIDQDKAYVYSDAAIRLTKYLHRAWPLAQAMYIIPGFIRNSAYRYFAKRRYQWFGKAKACMLPTADIRARYLD